MAERHAFSHEIFAFIYIYILIVQNKLLQYFQGHISYNFVLIKIWRRMKWGMLFLWNDKLTILPHISLLASSNTNFVVLFLTIWFSSILPHNFYFYPTLSFRYLMMYYYLMGWFHNNFMVYDWALNFDVYTYFYFPFVFFLIIR